MKRDSKRNEYVIFPHVPLSCPQVEKDDNKADIHAKQKDKEDLEEVSTELELADEDELVPYVFWGFRLPHLIPYHTLPFFFRAVEGGS